MNIDLGTEYLGGEPKNPSIASAWPLTTAFDVLS